MVSGSRSAVRLLAAVVAVLLFGAGCGTQAGVTTGTTEAHSAPSSTPIPLDLDSPAVVAQLIAGYTPRDGIGDRGDAQMFDTPALVGYLNAHRGPQLTDRDHWVVTMRNSAGQRVSIFDCEYVRSQHDLRHVSVFDIPPQDPTSAAAFPWLASATAVARLHELRGLAPAAGFAPHLIYFDIDNRWRDPGSPIKWYGGGDSAVDPMWQIQATDGVTYFVGQDLKVYVYNDLPLEPAYK